MPKTIFGPANKAVVEAIRKARLEAGLTQAELAQRIGRDQSHISLIEGSQRRLDVVEFHQIAQALGADPNVLFAEVSAALQQMPDRSS